MHAIVTTVRKHGRVHSFEVCSADDSGDMLICNNKAELDAMLKFVPAHWFLTFRSRVEC